MSNLVTRTRTKKPTHRRHVSNGSALQLPSARHSQEDDNDDDDDEFDPDLLSTTNDDEEGSPRLGSSCRQRRTQFHATRSTRRPFLPKSSLSSSTTTTTSFELLSTCSSPKSSTSSSSSNKMPLLFGYMEMGDWTRAEQRLSRHPREARTWVTMKKVGKRLALHHACFKLRRAAAAEQEQQTAAAAAVVETTRDGTETTAAAAAPEVDTFAQICSFLLRVIQLNPAACQERESRHGCLPLHLAAFSSCASRRRRCCPTQQPEKQQQQQVGTKPALLNRRCRSEGTALSHASYDRQQRPGHSYEDWTIHHAREEQACQVIRALLEAHPKACRMDSEGGRLPLHLACAGRATPRVVATLLTAYPAAARHRNKDGFLPLHLAAHWGVSHPTVAIALLQTYPDATVGRNRWERTPLEEALCMAGENGRPHQSSLVRALRKHPSFWVARSSSSGSSGRKNSTVSLAVDVDDSLASSTQEEENVMQKMISTLGRGQGGDKNLTATISTGTNKTKEPTEEPSFLTRFLPTSLSSVAPTLLSTTTTTPPVKNVRNLSLDALIHKHDWDNMIERLLQDPMEAEKDLRIVTKGGFKAGTGFTALHYACERNPPVTVVAALLEAHPVAALTRCMPGGCLPLHIACTWHADTAVVEALLAADQGGAEVTDELGNVPLHSACFSGAAVSTIEVLLQIHAKAANTRNHHGSRPLDVTKRLRHENRTVVTQMLELQCAASTLLDRQEHQQHEREQQQQQQINDVEQRCSPENADLADNNNNNNNPELCWI